MIVQKSNEKIKVESRFDRFFIKNINLQFVESAYYCINDGIERNEIVELCCPLTEQEQQLRKSESEEEY